LKMAKASQDFLNLDTKTKWSNDRVRDLARARRIPKDKKKRNTKKSEFDDWFGEEKDDAGKESDSEDDYDVFADSEEARSGKIPGSENVYEFFKNEDPNNRYIWSVDHNYDLDNKESAWLTDRILEHRAMPETIKYRKEELQKQHERGKGFKLLLPKRGTPEATRTW
jgi:hypothetical protein